MDRTTVRPLKELLDSVRKIEGFPNGKDEDILALSDPPFYTACPNPYIADFIKEYGKPHDSEKDDYHREPFVGDVSEGKGNSIYRLHSYHTKVPHPAIMKFIEHYTNPGDIVFDGFCGSGMTGVAAKLTNRRYILSELSPYASSLSYRYSNLTLKAYETGLLIIAKLEKNFSHLYRFEGSKIEYIINSEEFVCPYCEDRGLFWDAIVDEKNHRFKDDMYCKNCNSLLIQKNIEKVRNSSHKAVLRPILIGLKKSKSTVKRNVKDMQVNMDIADVSPYWYPDFKMLFKGEEWGEMYVRTHHTGISKVSDFFTSRNLIALSALWDEINKIQDYRTRQTLSFVFTSIIQRSSLLNRLRPSGSGDPMTGTLYVSSLIREENVFSLFKRKLVTLKNTIDENSKLEFSDLGVVQTASTTDLSNIPSNSIDYIFVDPPFGRNLMYSELNFMMEAWMKVFTNSRHEAIKSAAQNKDLEDYSSLMTKCFSEMYRILKPKRWITIEFHNSEAAIWNVIQSSLNKAKFIIVQVNVLDKQQRSYKQVIEVGSVENDLIITAYKADKEFSENFITNAGEGLEVSFVSQQLEILPLRPNIGRSEKMLFSKMLAHYVENGFKIRYNSTNFYKLLSENFTELDGYWFLDYQVKDYNRWKRGLSLDELKERLDGQQVLLISDEKSAITWLYTYLAKPRSYSDIYIEYQKFAIKSDDDIPELRTLIEKNFVLEEEKYRRPLNESERAELERNREKELGHAFNNLLVQCRSQKGKIKQVRREVLVHGFTECYQEGRYQDILTIADKLYDSTIESSGEMMDFIDIAKIKTAGDTKKTLDGYGTKE